MTKIKGVIAGLYIVLAKCQLFYVPRRTRAVLWEEYRKLRLNIVARHHNSLDTLTDHTSVGSGRHKTHTAPGQSIK